MATGGKDSQDDTTSYMKQFFSENGLFQRRETETAKAHSHGECVAMWASVVKGESVETVKGELDVI